MVRNRGFRSWALAALVLALSAAACTKPPLVPLRGRVLDPDTREPLAGVRVSSRERQTTTGADGGYALPVALGGRQLTFEVAGRPAAKKFVILDEEVPERQLDVLLPSTAPAGLALALGRSWAFTGGLKDFEDQWEAEGDSNLSAGRSLGKRRPPAGAGPGQLWKVH